jgi:hypothetical protein
LTGNGLGIYVVVIVGGIGGICSGIGVIGGGLRMYKQILRTPKSVRIQIRSSNARLLNGYESRLKMYQQRLVDDRLNETN